MRRVSVVLSGNYDLSTLIVGPTALYPFFQLPLRNLTEVEVVGMCQRVCSMASDLGGLRFDDAAMRELYQQTYGDKYFTNLVGSRSILSAEKDGAAHDYVVRREHILDVASAIRRGRSGDIRVMPRIKRLFAQFPGAREYARSLAEFGPDYWSSIPPEIRQKLFLAGIVGPGETREEPKTNEGPSPERGGRSITLNDYAIRNPMLEEWLTLTRASTTMRLEGKAGSASALPKEQRTWEKGREHTSIETTIASSEGGRTARDFDNQRWHALLDRRATGRLTPSESKELLEMAKYVDEDDKKELLEGAGSLDRLLARHEKVIGALDRLTETIKSIG